MKYFSGAGHDFGARKEIFFWNNDASEGFQPCMGDIRDKLSRAIATKRAQLLWWCTVNLLLPQQSL